MRANFLRCFGIALVTLSLLGCSKETGTITSEPLSEYLPLHSGKYITYRLDSTVFTNFGRNEEVRYFEEKHVVDAQVTDNLGRTSYRIFRFLRDTLGGAWSSAGTYYITPTAQTMEVIENNFRVVK